MKNQIQSNDEIVSLWKTTKTRQKEIEKKEEELDLKIFDELGEIAEKKKELCDKEREKLSSEAKKLLEMKKVNENAKKKSKAIFLLISISFIIVLSLFRFLLDDIIPSSPIAYVIIAACSLIAAIVLTCMRNKKLANSINQINTNEEIKSYMTVIDKISKELAKEEEFIENRKYKDEKEEIQKAYESNDYKGVKQRYMKYYCGNTVYFYFKKIAMMTSYKILVDGAETFYSKEKYQKLRLNPGYHSISVNVIYHSDTLKEHKEYCIDFQVGNADLPMFFVCDKLEVASWCVLKEVSAEKYEEISNVKILPD